LKFDLPADVFLSDSPERFRSLMLTWFDRSKRSLPWRTRKSLYGTWISEIMLQQTTVTVVVPHWEKFLVAFPDVQALASADQQDVLSQWSGLGYYRRARLLHQAARMVVSRWGGKFPVDRDGWLELPGVGPYASGAIASIGLGKRVPALDANARRVLSRWLVAAPPALNGLRPAHLDKISSLLVDPERPGDWNEALMELGALICRASTPRCGVCPVRDQCRAGCAGTADLIPAPKTTVVSTRVKLGLLVLTWRDRVLLLPPATGPVAFPEENPHPVRSDTSCLYMGLWGLPSTPWLPGHAGGPAAWPGGIWRPWLATVPNLAPFLGEQDPVLVGKFRHAITRYRLVVQVYGMRLVGGPALNFEDSLQSAITWSKGGISVTEEGKEGTHPTGRFWPWPVSGQPVSNLVKKSLVIAGKGIV